MTRDAPTLSDLNTAQDETESSAEESRAGVPSSLVLVVLWSVAEPRRVGEVFEVPARHKSVWLLGRGEASASDEGGRLIPTRRRPGEEEAQPPLGDRKISRRQLRITPQGTGETATLMVENLGRRPLLVGGTRTSRAVVGEGAILELRKRLLLRVERRPRMSSAFSRLAWRGEAHVFGMADALGIVGETPTAWALRERIGFVGARRGHTLILGESGAGKELVAGAVHAASSRSAETMISRNAATIPEGLIDAELFGNARNYPNAGMPARPGLIGAADGSTLFLDEIAELPTELQSHLLRVLDEGGEYHRLGEFESRRADIRLVGATNRSVDELRHDLSVRFPLRIELPGLNERRADIPLLIVHLMRKIAAEDAAIAARFMARSEGGAGLSPRLEMALVSALVRHRYTHHVRELSRLLWISLASSPDEQLALTDELDDALNLEPARPEPEEPLTPEKIQESLDRHQGVQAKVWRELGLKNRHVLRRLIQKHDLRTEPLDGDDDE